MAIRTGMPMLNATANNPPITTFFLRRNRPIPIVANAIDQ